MNNNIAKEPLLRFPGFDDEWGKEKLGDVIKSAYSGGTPPRKNRKYYESKDIPWVSIGDMSRNKSIFINSADEYISEIAITENKSKVFPRGTILYAMYASVGEMVITAKDNIATSQAVLGIQNKENIVDKFFLFYILFQEKRNFLKLIQHGTQPNLNKTIIINHKISLPSLEEQSKIGSFFKTLDSLIENQESYIEKLEKEKKGLLQDIFSRDLRLLDDNGEKFKGEWKEVKLGDIIVERKILKTLDTKIPHVSLTIDGIIDKSERYNRDFLVKSENKKYRLTKLNDICYNPANLKFGVITINKYGDALFSPIYATFEKRNSEVDMNYLSNYIMRWDFINKVRKYEEGTVPERTAVKPKDFVASKILLPSLEEQKAIGLFFKKIDEKIEKERELLENYKDMKKGLLQDMFI